MKSRGTHIETIRFILEPDAGPRFTLKRGGRGGRGVGARHFEPGSNVQLQKETSVAKKRPRLRRKGTKRRRGGDQAEGRVSPLWPRETFARNKCYTMR